MRQAVLRGMVLLLGLVLLSSCAKEAPQEIEWASSLDDAFGLAAEKSQPIVAEFWSDGCKWCKRLEDSTLTHQSVVQLAKNMVFVKAEAKKDTVVKDRYQIA